MNGRIYDPLLGRMLSADLFVQFMGNVQSYNRYSYNRNNPLSLIDPTGYASGTGQKTPEELAREQAEQGAREALIEARGISGYLSMGETGQELIKAAADFASHIAADLVGGGKASSMTPLDGAKAISVAGDKIQQASPVIAHDASLKSFKNSSGLGDCVPVAWREIIRCLTNEDPGDLRDSFSVALGAVDENGKPNHSWIGPNSGISPSPLQYSQVGKKFGVAAESKYFFDRAELKDLIGDDPVLISITYYKPMSSGKSFKPEKSHALTVRALDSDKCLLTNATFDRGDDIIMDKARLDGFFDVGNGWRALVNMRYEEDGSKVGVIIRGVKK
jgi:hypothetical protein